MPRSRWALPIFALVSADSVLPKFASRSASTTLAGRFFPRLASAIFSRLDCIGVCVSRLFVSLAPDHLKPSLSAMLLSQFASACRRMLNTKSLSPLPHGLPGNPPPVANGQIRFRSHSPCEIREEYQAGVSASLVEPSPLRPLNPTVADCGDANVAAQLISHNVAQLERWCRVWACNQFESVDSHFQSVNFARVCSTSLFRHQAESQRTGRVG